MIPPLYEHQKECLRRLAQNDVYAILMEMGCGKSRVVCEEMIRRNINMLVIAPKGCYRTWAVELEKYTEPGTVDCTHWSSGPTKAEALAVAHIIKPSNKRRAFLMNIEALSSVKAARQAVDDFIKSGPTMVVIDESTKIRSFNSNRTKAVLDIGSKVKVKRILSGLVTPRSPMDLFAQFYFLSWRILGSQNYYSFRSRYAILKKMNFGGRTFDQIVGFRNVEELKEKVAKYSYRVLKSDCLDLPPKIYTERVVELSGDQRKAYSELVKNATTQLNSGEFVTTTTAISMILRLHQIVCGHVRDDLGNVTDIYAGPREEALMEVLEECEGKAIIWCSYRHGLRRIIELVRKEYGDGSVVEYWGDTKDDQREIAKDRFQNDPTCRFFISNPATGSLGLTLTAANTVVYYSNSYDLEHRQQSEDRAHRSGLRHPVVYVDITAKGTVDEKILKALKNKINLAATITGESVREWIR